MQAALLVLVIYYVGEFFIGRGPICIIHHSAKFQRGRKTSRTTINEPGERQTTIQNKKKRTIQMNDKRRARQTRDGAKYRAHLLIN